MKRAWLNMGHWVSAFLIFGICFGITAHFLSKEDLRFRAWQDGELLGDKKQEYLALKDQINVIFVGTSRVRHGVIPKLYDELLSAQGVPTKSYNFAINGGNFREEVHILKFIRDNPPPHPYCIFIEPRFSPDRSLDDLLSNRFMQSNLEGSLYENWCAQLANPRDSENVSGYLIDFLEARGVTMWAIGSLSYRLRMVGVSPEEVSMDLNLAGYQPLIEEGNRVQVWGDIEQKDFLKKKADLLGKEKISLSKSKEWKVVIDRLLVEAEGAEAVYFLCPPAVGKPGYVSQGIIEYAEKKKMISKGYFLNPVAYPELYEADLWFDAAHLNPKGAEKHTRALAAEVLKAKS